MKMAPRFKKRRSSVVSESMPSANLTATLTRRSKRGGVAKIKTAVYGFQVRF